MKVRLKIMSRVKFTLFELLCYLFNLHLILIAYLVLIRRTLGTEQTLTIIDKIYWPYWYYVKKMDNLNLELYCN